MKTSSFFIIFTLVLSCKNAQIEEKNSDTFLQFTWEKIGVLDKDQSETSGLVYYNGSLITHNDSGDDARIYFLDEKGKETERTHFKNMKADDWEDIASDDTHLYIGDTGNNNGSRKNLKIYKVALTDMKHKKANVSKISFSYKDQKDFKIKKKNNPYDAESLVAIDNYLYIFSKDRKSLKTQVYQIDKNKSKQKLSPIASYDIKGLITGATYNGKNDVFLCGYDSNLNPFLVRIKYQNGNFTFDQKYDLAMVDGAQIEAITYAYTDDYGNDVYYLTSESASIEIDGEKVKSEAELFQLVWKKRD